MYSSFPSPALLISKGRSNAETSARDSDAYFWSPNEAISADREHVSSLLFTMQLTLSTVLSSGLEEPLSHLFEQHSELANSRTETFRGLS